MSGLTSSGFDRKRLVDILANIEAAEKAIWNDNIDVSPESRFGQLNGIIAEAISDQWEGQEDLYNAFIPSSSSGTNLSNLVQLNGIERRNGEKSTVTATITGTVGLTIPAGSLASVTGTEAMFETLDTLVIPAAGFDDVAMESVDEGPIEAAVGTLTQIETPIFGWTAITNAAAASLGQLEETDPELRARREISVAAGGNNLADALAAQLNNTEDVTDAIVIENKTDIVDANGLDPHTFAAVVIGGTAIAIATVIWANTPQGIDSFGALSEVITDEQGFPQTINYSRAADIAIYFKLDLTTDANYPGDGDARVKAAVVEYGQSGTVNGVLLDSDFLGFGIYDDVILSKFYTPINTVPGIVGIIITMNKTGAPVVETANIVIAYDEISRYDAADITII
jgi:uncharacterized phage protein gp47/JayE